MNPELFIAIRYFKSKKRNIFISLLTVISILVVIIAVTSLIVVNSVVGGFEKEITQKTIENEPHILIYSKGDVIPDKEFYSLANRIKNIDEVMVVTPFVSSTVLITSEDNLTAIKISGVEPKLAKKSYGIFRNLIAGKLDYMSNPNQAYVDYKTKMNRYFLKNRKQDLKNAKTKEEKEELQAEIDFLAKNKILPPKGKQQCLYIGKALADALRVGVGGSLKIITPFGDIGPTGLMPKTRKFRVCGVFFTSLYEYDYHMVFASLKSVKKLLGVNEISGIEIKVKNIYKMEHVTENVKKAIDSKRFKVSGFSKMNKNLFSALKMEEKGKFLLFFIIMLVASFNIMATLTLIVNSRKNDISILRALGYSKASIRKMYIYRGAIIGFIGSVIGTVFAFIALYMINRLFKINQDVYYIENLPINVVWWEIVLIVLITFFVTLMASVIPASKAASITPVDGLKGK